MIAQSAKGVSSRAMAGILLLALAAVALAIDADRNPVHGAAWCLVGGDSGRSCGYHTYEQCMASRAGGTSHCTQNTN
jgi:uncharacterized protein DUF3551